ncbi:uncharacterized protein BO80DRAFT_199674 [Aspergillus ibericus CBS 121593]|uniref:Uncharacterized protein n=1 Tax=Aspergillus ibericus CBS 121593 TaxID=1448316 RepID=A0A395GSE2_9EURO|nr:hypothetical protein BO80DRAFT_199674 [Aspergillus ibericus CBS 121593]RAK97003.1 hypothetical protein BO80DRAFT_199674 [Aspergillus ibericus CBS 121593]
MDFNTNTNTNTSTHPLDTSDPLFYLCWRRQSCNSCLKGDVPCSWCAVVFINLHPQPHLHPDPRPSSLLADLSPGVQRALGAPRRAVRMRSQHDDIFDGRGVCCWDGGGVGGDGFGGLGG